MRFLYANNWKFDKTHKSMFEYIQWKKEKLPPELTMNVKNFLVKKKNYKNSYKFSRILVYYMFMEEIIDSVQ